MALIVAVSTADTLGQVIVTNGCGYYSAYGLYIFKNMYFNISGRYDSNKKNVILFAECLRVLFFSLLLKYSALPLF